MTCKIYLKKDFMIDELIDNFLKRNFNGDSGAIYLFIGTVKKNGRRGTVDRLYLESYIEAANDELAKICSELKKKYLLNDIEIGHATGEFKIGEPIVYVGIAAESRGNMYNAMKEAIEQYKNRPPIFKKEIYVDGSEEWI